MRLVLFCILSLLFSKNVLAQLPEGKTFHPSLAGANSWKYSPDLSEEQLYQYDRLLYMSRDDWDMFRTDPRYNEERIREIYKENKGKLTQGLRAGGGAEKTNENCDCWIEPDETYTESDPNGWTNSGGGGLGVDVWFGPIQLPFNFCFFGQNFNQIAITSKGTIVMGPTGYIDWTPSEFPNPTGGESTEQYDQIAAFWADFDFRATGQLFYKVTNEAFYLNFVDVGYFANHDNLTNTFQVILTPEDSPVLGDGNNVQFCYCDMQWAHGDVGGSGGFSGPSPANVGADRIAGSSHIQFGRFNLNNANYNGPYGINTNQQDGINWLDNRSLNFDVCSTNSNIPPLSTSAAPNDTIFLCQGQVYTLNTQFLSPENGQNTSITVTQTGTGFTSTQQNGNTASINGTFTASASNIGPNTVTITATDNGAISQSTVLTYVFVVTDDVPPTIEISGNLGICAGGSTILSATPGFDSYSWSTGCNTQECNVTQGGNVTVTGFSGDCASTATAFVDASNFFIPDFVTGNEPISLCPGITQEVCLEEAWQSYSWDVYEGYEGLIPSGTVVDQQCFLLSGDNPGFYSVIVTDENGCQGLNIQEVIQIESFIDEANNELSGAYCEGLEPVSFIGGFSNPANGNLLIYAQDGSSTGWQGSYLNVVITHLNGTTDTYLVTATSTFTISSAPITLGDTWTFTYVSNGNAAQDANNSFWAINCNGEIWNSTQELGPGLSPGLVYEGESTCAPSQLTGQWTVTGPAGWSLTTLTAYNPINAQGVSSPNIFTPGDFGLYTLCFTDPECDLDYCYELEYTESPELTITPGSEIILCDGATSNPSILVTDIGGTGEITWTGTNVTPAANQLSAIAGPYSGYSTHTVTATITNGCGTASDSYSIVHQPSPPTPIMSDGVICLGTSTTFDPVPASQDNAALQYQWTPGNQTTPTISASTEGNYCVTVSNLCGTSLQVCADVIVTQLPTLAITPNADVVLCNNETSAATIVVTDIGGQGQITWTGDNVTPSANLLSAIAGPYSGYTTATVSATITNACGSATDSYTIIHQPSPPNPQLQDAVICNNASITLDPIPAAQDNPALLYAWTPQNQSSSTIVVSAAGTYCVTVSNLCGTSLQECAVITNVVPANAPALPASVVECNASSVTLSTTVPAGYSIQWSSGEVNTNSIDVEFSGNYCFTITDNQGCNTEMVSCADVIITQVPTTFSGTDNVNVICPTECEVFNLQATDATSYSWEASCPSLTPLLGNNATASVCSDAMPLECQLQDLQIIGTATNACGSSSSIFLVRAEPCSVRIPNVITPNGDATNNNFVIEGIENYPGTTFKAYNRNGSLVYESDNYRNNWNPRDLNEGTYFYVVELPFGATTVYKGTFTILK